MSKYFFDRQAYRDYLTITANTFAFKEPMIITGYPHLNLKSQTLDLEVIGVRLYLYFIKIGPIDNQSKGGGFDLECDLRDESCRFLSVIILAEGGIVSFLESFGYQDIKIVTNKIRNEFRWPYGSKIHIQQTLLEECLWNGKR